MSIAEFKRDVWGREVLLGVSWDLLWVILAVSFAFIALHAIYKAVAGRSGPKPSSEGPRVARHAAIDRLFHWVMAVSVFVLLVTGIFPIIGIEFDWLTIHWIAGLVLTVAVLFHIVRAFWLDLGSMWISARDLKEPFDASIKPGKYSLAQKSMHATVTVLSILVIGSGLVMFAMIDTPWWNRTNALSEATLGWVFFIHGLSTLLLVATIALHVYFGLRPEKLFYLRSMIKGWVSRDELEAHHDSSRWSAGEPR